MVSFTSEIEEFFAKGEKTGWKYITIPQSTAHQIKPNFKRSFRVRGLLDQVQISGMATVPMGDGNFILALKAALRKELGKQVGDPIYVQIEEDLSYKIEIPEELMTCLMDDPILFDRFSSLTPSHQSYFIKHITDAKTIETRIKRIAMTLGAMENQWDFGKMIRENRTNKN